MAIQRLHWTIYHVEEKYEHTCGYESQFENTELLARSIAAIYSAFSSAQLVHVDPTHPLDLKGVDVFIVASPTQGFRQMRTMHTLLESLSNEELGHLCVACFDIRVHLPWPLNSSAAKEMARQLRRKRHVCARQRWG
ncbi:MAG TPA: hypothetical protein VH593_27100 [Ktedonobacteraceae bacterium]|jgi:hypothetical protein